jgi:NADH-quinone oxidoreductase subunit N
MWPTTVMEVLFTGGMLSLALGVVGKGSKLVRDYGPGAAAAGAMLVSLGSLLSGWASSLGSVVQLQPTQSSFASLYLADRFTAFAAFTVLVVGLAVAAYSVRYSGVGRRGGPFYALLLLLMCSLIGVISAGDFLSLFLFWEGMSVSAYGLVSFTRSPLSMEASVKYFLMAGVGSLLALYGIAAIYSASGTIQFAATGLVLQAGARFGEFGLAMLVVGLGVEAAVVPLHTWLPDVYSASSISVAAVVSGAVTGTGVFALLKVVQPLVPGAGFAPAGPGLPGVGSVQLVLAALAFATMLVGNLSALAQVNLRKMLSFSSIAQTGYMLAALSTLSVTGLVAVVFTIWNHGIVKSNFFMVIGEENSSFDSASLERLRGAGRGNRVLGFFYGSSSLAMMGAPPFGMFWSEILIVQSLLFSQGALFDLLAAAVVLNIVLSIGYYFRVINTVVFGDSPGAPERRPSGSLVSPAFLLALSLMTGIVPFLLLGRLM